MSTGWSETWRSFSPSDLMMACQCLHDIRLDDFRCKGQNPTTRDIIDCEGLPRPYAGLNFLCAELLATTTTLQGPILPLCAKDIGSLSGPFPKVRRHFVCRDRSRMGLTMQQYSRRYKQPEKFPSRS